jgi:hypothetical protein
MSGVQILPFITTAVIFVFAVLVFRRYAQRGGLHSLIWGIGLTMYGLGTLAEALLAMTYSPVILHSWYLFGAILTPAWLGQGTVHLLVRRKQIANVLLVILIIATVIATVKVFSLPTNDALYQIGVPVSAQYKEVMPRDSFTTMLLSAFALYGTVTLVGGALYSAYIFLRKRIMPQRVLGNVFIAIGGLSPALGGVFASRGLGDYLFVSELIGAILIFIGFRLATTQQPVAAPPASTPAATAA